MSDDLFPVMWKGPRAIVTFPEDVNAGNAGQLREQLLSVLNRGAAVLIGDMTGTASCDHSAVDALARAYQRATVSGAQLRLVVPAPVIMRVLSIEGLDRLVSIYPTLEAALTPGEPGEPGGPAAPAAPVRLQAGRPPPDGAALRAGTDGVAGVSPAVLWQLLDTLGDGLALVGGDGEIMLANRRCAEMFGYPREELIGLGVDSLVPFHVQAVHRHYQVAFHEAPHRRPMGERARLAGLRRDGATFPVDISLTPVPTATDGFVLAVIRDPAEMRRRGDLADLAMAVAAERSHRTSELLDRIVHHLFQVGLSLQAAADLPGREARERISAALALLDDTITEIRDHELSADDPA
jgi:anti-anti-sigma factor